MYRSEWGALEILKSDVFEDVHHAPGDNSVERTICQHLLRWCDGELSSSSSEQLPCSGHKLCVELLTWLSQRTDHPPDFHAYASQSNGDHDRRAEGVQTP